MGEVDSAGRQFGHAQTSSAHVQGSYRISRLRRRESRLKGDTMPPRDERSLPDEVYLEILVFILRANKVPVGSHELKPEPETLKQIMISEPG